jgi:hypothetical protein
MPTTITKEALLAKAAERRYKDVPVPELGEGVEIRVQAMSSKQFEEYESEMIRRVRGGRIATLVGLKSLLMIRCVIDANGNPMFTEEDLPALNELDGGICDRLSKAAQDVNLMNEKALEQARSDFNSLAASSELGSDSPDNSECPSPEPGEK